ncbi:unnamed protein product [Cuscuta campestris]|uniref:Response regulatory domain-containing protein n=2 Tax=Cuscuta sect. Cleistogrammica TaxID=1824901 RepID=A0A484NIX7_9ASTE|nr:hypothetical protein DM860_012090 [Cuscuta australis]VFR00458.1 unnamed protein product [Cuscuta campestris]
MEAAAKSSSSSANSSPSSSATSSPTKEKKAPQVHVLAVDDCASDRKLIERIFQASSCKVTTADCGHKALELLATLAPKVDLIVTDYSMPGMTGYELLKFIKASPSMKHIPVVILSSDNLPARINECKERGAQDFLIKPFKISDVKKIMPNTSK